MHMLFYALYEHIQIIFCVSAAIHILLSMHGTYMTKIFVHRYCYRQMKASHASFYVVVMIDVILVSHLLKYNITSPKCDGNVDW